MLGLWEKGDALAGTFSKGMKQKLAIARALVHDPEVIFMAATEHLTHGGLSYYYFPNLTSGIMLFLLAPLAAVFSIESAVIASSRVSDVRGANQIAGLMFLPFMVVFLAAVEGVFAFTTDNLLIVAGVVLIADVALFFLSTSTFRREEILTKWR